MVVGFVNDGLCKKVKKFFPFVVAVLILYETKDTKNTKRTTVSSTVVLFFPPANQSAVLQIAPLSLMFSCSSFLNSLFRLSSLSLPMALCPLSPALGRWTRLLVCTFFYCHHPFIFFFSLPIPFLSLCTQTTLPLLPLSPSLSRPSFHPLTSASGGTSSLSLLPFTPLHLPSSSSRAPCLSFFFFSLSSSPFQSCLLTIITLIQQ